MGVIGSITFILGALITIFGLILLIFKKTRKLGKKISKIFIIVCLVGFFLAKINGNDYPNNEPGTINKAQYKQIKEGMTKDEIIDALGEPHSKDDEIHEWTYIGIDGVEKNPDVVFSFNPDDKLELKMDGGLLHIVDSTTVSQDTPEQKDEIDTSVFEYAKDVEVTNAIEINKHVTVFVDMDESLKPGLATQHVVNQTYDFIQQKDIKGAKTVTIAVRQGDIKIAQFTVNKEKFTPIANKPMSECVMKASKIDMMTDKVKEYGAIIGNW